MGNEMSKICCHNQETFFETIYGLVKCGVIFRANAVTFEIELTGGF